MVAKKDGRREVYDRQKVLAGLTKACEKEVPSSVIGEAIMRELHKLDPVAYVRFASVYRRFQEATDFVQEIQKLEEAK